MKRKFFLLYICSVFALFLLSGCDIDSVSPRGRINPNDPYCPLSLTYIYLDNYYFEFYLDINIPEYDSSWAKEDVPEAFFITGSRDSIPHEIWDGSSFFGFWRNDTSVGINTFTLNAYNINNFNEYEPANYYINVYWTNDFRGSGSDLYNGNLGDNDTEWMGPLSISHYYPGT